MSWTQGYYASEGYTYGFCSELAPARLALTALLAGHTPPNLRRSFRYLDLGCGQGLNLCLLAATHPQAQFVGVDFLPDHIAHGRSLAAAAGLANIIFVEADFQSLAAAASSGNNSPLGGEPFDFAVAHGILTWIAPDLQQAVLELASCSLRPGGLLFLSANTLPGWLDRLALQHLATGNLQRGHHGPKALEQAIGLCEQLRQAQAGLFRYFPTLTPALDALAGRSPAYLRQEYLNQHWQPLFADQLLSLAQAHKFSFLASATLHDRFDGLLPGEQQQLIAAQDDPSRRELVRDLILGQAFRKDVFAKGFQPLWGKEQQSQINALQLVSLTPMEQLADSGLYSLQLGIGPRQASEDNLRPILELISEEPCSLAQICEVLARRAGSPATAWRSRVFDRVLLLLASGLAAVVPDPNVDPAPAQRLNQQLVQAIADGAPYAALAAPTIGNGWPWRPGSDSRHPDQHPELLERLGITAAA